jgi:hypothetical protein
VSPVTAATSRCAEPVDAFDWGAIATELDEIGCALTPPLLGATEAAALTQCYEDDEAFRSTIQMARYRFGEGEYRYFASPLPEVVTELRRALYPHLLPVARDWYAKLGRNAPWPDDLEEWLAICHAAGQTKPTPLLLRYGPGDWERAAP